ncbi:hypothetical protein BS47DRAFT_689168 [Hydnum rufescens UP504]|uniref:Uncharacterized protein n=1 Tax=Hydnum rufescens UP504 TaxID=1448309 RepID=A0A9P6B3G8_9AGAM|nr:hypothetical protein BS47DRAFT_689168 [Hydnum rufescens UP504]
MSNLAILGLYACEETCPSTAYIGTQMGKARDGYDDTDHRSGVPLVRTDNRRGRASQLLLKNSISPNPASASPSQATFLPPFHIGMTLQPRKFRKSSHIRQHIFKTGKVTGTCKFYHQSIKSPRDPKGHCGPEGPKQFNLTFYATLIQPHSWHTVMHTQTCFF